VVDIIYLKNPVWFHHFTSICLGGITNWAIMMWAFWIVPQS